MNAKWTVVHAQAQFLAPLGARFDLFKHQFLAAATGEDVDRLWAQKKIFLNFLNELRAVKASDDPPARLRPAFDTAGSAIEPYCVLRLGMFSAYYRVDHDLRLCVGVYVCLDADAAEDIVTRLIRAFDDYRAGPGGGR